MTLPAVECSAMMIMDENTVMSLLLMMMMMMTVLMMVMILAIIVDGIMMTAMVTLELRTRMQMQEWMLRDFKALALIVLIVLMMTNIEA